MKYSMMLGAALCALGAVAEVEPSMVTEWTTKTVTDWTVVTITKTITVPGTTSTEVITTSTPAAVETSTVAPTTTSTPDTQVKVKDAAAEPVVQETSTPTLLPTISVEPTSTVESTSTAEPVTTEPAATTEPAEEPQATSWSTSWESTWSQTQEPTTQEPTSTAAATETQAPVNGYQHKVLNSHNVHRANHSSSDLSWSSDLQQSAQVLASRCVYEHDTSINGGNYGQNIGYGTSADDVGVMISNLMYNDEMGYFSNLYGQATPDMTLFEKWGHFSQIVWSKSTEVGCATVSCPSLGNVDSAQAVPFTVCNYSPAGNYDGEYAENVKAPLGQPMWSA